MTASSSIECEIDAAAKRLRARSTVTILTPRRGAPLPDLRYALVKLPEEPAPVRLDANETRALFLLAEQDEVELVLPFAPLI